MDDFKYMSIALALAKQNIGCTSPNPSVGCLIVKNNQIIAQAATNFGGRPHAETIALEIAGKNAHGAVAYITLEPCSHQGVTSPCVATLIAAKISKVVIATKDPDPRVNGNGINLLKNAGIEVLLGVAESEAIKLNEGFFKSKLQNLPLVTLKLATSLDGKIALKNKNSKWISCEKSRQYAHQLRAENDAILVGIGTVLADDPALTCRLKDFEHKSPIRIILDSKLSFPLSAKMLDDCPKIPLWIITNNFNTDEKSKILMDKGVKIINLESDKNIISTLHHLAQLGITRLLVEGGRTIATSFLVDDMIDYLIWISSNKIIGNDGIAAIGNLDLHSLENCPEFLLEDYFKLDNDLVRIFKNNILALSTS
jgi:diaminohydroxyphosphoribosylaminopyrimidine deaminase/5-amino-6-(5-phosphoribosylamino)uracil reductase